MARARETHAVEVYNTAKQSENKMHDDTVARRFGFAGGLVPGVDVMAYMIHLPVARRGRAGRGTRASAKKVVMPRFRRGIQYAGVAVNHERLGILDRLRGR